MLSKGLPTTDAEPIAPDRPESGQALSFAPFAGSEIEQSITRRFEAQVRRYGRRPAISASGRTTCYDELNRRSNRIARALLSRRGCSPEAVALLLGQGADLIAATLAVLKTGKFYFGLDVRRPGTSLRATLVACRAPLLLTASATGDLAARVAPPGTEILNLDRIDSFPEDDLGLEISPDALAYRFQTSGSTGLPKSVVDCHRNVLHNIRRYTNTLRIGADDRLSLLQSPSFSGSVSSLFAALLNGACVCPFDLHAGSGEDLAQWLSRERVTIYHSVPTIFRSFLSGDRVFPDVRVIRLEGDQAARSDVSLFRKHFGPRCVLVNGLGTTETGLVSQFFVRRDTEISDGVLPVGYAVEGMAVSVVARDGRSMAPGEVGEIAVASEYLAVGYENRPDLTRERFGDTFRAGRRRTYRTGDLGWMDGDGCLRHLGRKGSDVKVRGESVEPAEVESAILDLPCIRDAAVIATKDREGDARLVAYVVPAERPGPTVSQLRRRMADAVPASMIPAIWVTLEELPRNAAGKIDRRTLPPPRGERPALDAPFAPAATPVQVRLAEIWEELLEVHPVGSRDDFFELGGNSLLALRLLVEVRRVFEADLSPSALLEASTVEALADRIVGQGQHLQTPIVTLRASGTRRPLVYLHGDYLSGGFYGISLARHLSPEQPLYTIAPCGADGSRIPPTYGEMAEIHLRALRELLPNGPYRLGGTCNGGLVAYEMARRLEASGESVELLALFGASAANLRFRRLRRRVEIVGALLGQRPEERSEAFARLRALALSLDRMAPRSRAIYLGRKVRKIPRNLAVVLRRRRAESHRQGRRADNDPPPAGPSLRDTYLRIDREYFPGPYSGRVTLLWPSEDRETPQQAANAWRKVAREVELHVIPGSHSMGLSGNVRLLSEETRALPRDAGERRVVCPVMAGARPDDRLRFDPEVLALPAADREFFRRRTATVARDLIGAWFARRYRGHWYGAEIVETEAYLGPQDRAAHSWGGRRTPRVEPMYADGGHLYVYFVYGMHFCANLVTRRAGTPEAVLLRAGEAPEGAPPGLLSGPAKLCAALGITTRDSGRDLLDGGPIRVFRRKGRRPRIAASPRVGVAYAGAAAHWPLRFYDARSLSVSRPDLSGKRGLPAPRGSRRR